MVSHQGVFDCTKCIQPPSNCGLFVYEGDEPIATSIEKDVSNVMRQPKGTLYKIAEAYRDAILNFAHRKRIKLWQMIQWRKNKKINRQPQVLRKYPLIGKHLWPRIM